MGGRQRCKQPCDITASDRLFQQLAGRHRFGIGIACKPLTACVHRGTAIAQIFGQPGEAPARDLIKLRSFPCGQRGAQFGQPVIGGGKAFSADLLDRVGQNARIACPPLPGQRPTGHRLNHGNCRCRGHGLGRGSRQNVLRHRIALRCLRQHRRGQHDSRAHQASAKSIHRYSPIIPAVAIILAHAITMAPSDSPLFHQVHHSIGMSTR